MYPLNKIIYVKFKDFEYYWVESEKIAPIVGYILDQNHKFYPSYITPRGTEFKSSDLNLPSESQMIQLGRYINKYSPYNIYNLKIKLGYAKFVPTQ